VVDRLGGASYHWVGNHNYVELSPWGAMAHVFAVRAPDGSPLGGAIAQDVVEASDDDPHLEDER
jgi:hypothetical protein